MKIKITPTLTNVAVQPANTIVMHVSPFDTAVTAILKSIIIAKGDLIVGTAVATSTNLPIGTNGQVLTVDTAQTCGLKWATIALPTFPACCRLTLATATPVSLADLTAKTQIFVAPYKGDTIGLFDGGSTWTLYAFTEKYCYSTDVQNGTCVNGLATITGLTDARRLAVGMLITAAHMAGTIVSIDSDTQVTGSANATASETVSFSFTIPATKNVDVFATYYNSAVALRQVIWTNDSTRATALTTQNGIYVLNGSTAWRYLGTYRTVAAGQTEDSITKRFVYNYYNRVERDVYVAEGTNHNYNGVARKWNNSDTNNKLEWIIGVAEERVRFNGAAFMAAGAAGSYAQTQVWFDGGAMGGFESIYTYTANYIQAAGLNVPTSIAAGYHYIQMYELSNHAGDTFLTMGITAMMFM